MSGKAAGRDALAVAIGGVGQAGPAAADARSIPEMVLAAVETALEDAALGFDDIDAVVTASVDLLDGLTASNMAVTEVVGAVMKPEIRIAADGLCAAIHAACLIGAGAYRTVLVVAHGKASMAPRAALERWAMDPIFLQPLGVDFSALAGLEAQLVCARDPQALDRWAATVSQRRAAALPHGVAGAIEPAEVRAAPLIASPLTRAMAAPAADAAYAVVLRAAPVRVAVRWLGAGHDLEAHAPGERPLGSRPGLRRAFERACRAARLEPTAPLGLLEPSCRYPHEEDLLRQALGPTCAQVALSPRGGLYAGDAPCAAGLGRLVDAARRLRVDPGLGRALVHGAWGPAGQGQAVAILEAA